MSINNDFENNEKRQRNVTKKTKTPWVRPCGDLLENLSYQTEQFLNKELL